MKRTASLVCLSIMLAWPTPATAGDKAVCASSYAGAQRQRKRAALLESRNELSSCLRECAEAARGDCARWLEEVERAIPSISVSVRRGGADARGFTLRVDGAEQRDVSRGIELNPGAHEIVVEVGLEKTSQSIVVVEGEKLRRVAFELAAAPTAPTPALVAALTPSPSPSESRAPEPGASGRPVPWQTVVFGAVGVAGLATFGGFALYGDSRYSDLEQCRPNCAVDDVSTTRTMYRIGDVGLGVGVLSLVVATVFYFVTPPRAPAAAALHGGPS